MDDYIEKIVSRSEKLKELISILKKKVNRFPEGRLRISMCNNVPRYYHSSGIGRGTYINAGNKKLVRSLAQKDYVEDVLASAIREYDYLNKFLRDYPDTPENVLNNIGSARRSLVEPLVLDDEMYAQRWLETPYVQRVIEKGVTTYPTIKGDRVVSKSEKIIADEMIRLGIPYKYDCRLELVEDGEVVEKFPDFTALNKKRRKIYYVEHLGMMDKKDYLERNLKKIELYGQNGIYPGEKLILFHETSDRPLDMDTMEKMLVRFLIE